MTFWALDWLRAFAITVVVELAVALPFLARIESSSSRRLGAVVLVNFATHPLVWFMFPGLTLNQAPREALSEIWAVVAETGAYWVICPQLGARRAALISLLANGCSYGLGLVLRTLDWL